MMCFVPLPDYGVLITLVSKQTQTARIEHQVYTARHRLVPQPARRQHPQEVAAGEQQRATWQVAKASNNAIGTGRQQVSVR